jgi:hypothetical protein
MGADGAAVNQGAWARCAPWIDAALEHAGRTHALADVEALVRDGDAQFWPGRASALVTEIHEFPRLRSLHLWLAGGDLGELVTVLRPCAEKWACGEGCTRTTIIGRPGWARALAPEGYRPAATVLFKEISR